MQVLIVDDSADAAASLTMLLELEDIAAQSVGDAEAALRLVEQTVPLLLLIVAFAVFPELHVTDSVRSTCVPSVFVPVAVNC